jgi:hypothetical protein
MGLDRFVRWTTTVPTVVQLRMLLEDYFGDIAAVSFENARFVCELNSRDSHAMRRMEHLSQAARDAAQYLTGEGEVRVIEVFVHDRGRYDVEPCIDIITRHADEFTNALAEGLMLLCARLWDGRLDIDQCNWLREEARRCEVGWHDARENGLDRLVVALRDRNWDGKAIDLLTQLVRCRNTSGDVRTDPDPQHSADLPSGVNEENGRGNG